MKVKLFKSQDVGRSAPKDQNTTMATANQAEVLKKAVKEERKLRSENTVLQQKVTELRATIKTLTTNHKKELRDTAPKLRKELESRTHEVEVSRKLVGSLLEEHEALSMNVSDREDTENTLRKSLEQAHLSLTQQAGVMKAEKERLELLNEFLTQEQTKLTAHIHRLRAQREEQDHRIDTLLIEIEQAKAEIVSVREDNELIRAQIYNTDRAGGPKNSEEHYLRSFQELSGDFENWVVRNSRAERQQKLTKEDEANLLALTRELGAYGPKTSRFLGSNDILREWYSNARSRMVLIRHIAAMFIYDQIFEPTVLGLPPDAAKLLRVIEHNILTQGLPGYCIILTF
jgi:chromosome segregation ATPase